MGEPAINFYSSHRTSFAEIETLAAGLGDPDLQERANELRAITESGNNFEPTPAQILVLNIQKKWESIYGTNIASWPAELQDSLETIKAGIGFASFNNNVISALQNLNIREETYPAYETGQAVVAELALPDLAKQALQLQANANSGIIPDSAARAGLSFISNPATLIIPMWSAGLFGRAAMGGVSTFGRFLGLTSESTVALAVAASIPVEAAAFMGTSHATQYVVQDFSPASVGRPEGLRYTVQEFAASTLFFGGLKLFSWAGALAQSILPATELGAMLARSTGHAASVLGLASMNRVQVVAGISEHGSSNFNEAFWQALFLHGTVQATTGVINVNGVKSNWAEMTKVAEEINGRGMDNWPVAVVTGGSGQSAISLPLGTQRAIQEAVGKRGGDMKKIFLSEGKDESGATATGSLQEIKDRKVGMFERAISIELGEMTSRQLSLQVSVSFSKHSDFLVRHGLAERSTVLDVGTGNGDFCCRLAKIYPNIQFTGIDLKSDLIERAIQLSNDHGITNTNWAIGDISTHQLGRVESSFDGVLLRYTDIHMPHIEATLALIRTILKPRGRIWIISVDLDHMNCRPPHEAFDAYKQGTERLYNKHGMDPHIGAKVPTMLGKAGYNSVVTELDPKAPQDIGLKEYQEYMLNEAILFHHFDPTALSRADLEKIGNFVEHVVPLPNYYGTYGTVMITAQK